MRANSERNPDYKDAFAFDNDFAALMTDLTPEIFDEDGLLVAESEAGLCRVVCFSPRHDLTLPVHPEVFAIGDMVSRPGVPGVAQAAIQEGKYVAKVISSRINEYPAPPSFSYKDKGTMATIGRTRAVASVRGVKLTGQLAFYIWAFVHVAYLVGWGNRFEAVARWMWTIVARNRRERLISPASLLSDEQVHEEIEATRTRSKVAA